MNTRIFKILGMPFVCAAVLLFLCAANVQAQAVIPGDDTGPAFTLTAGVGSVSTADGGAPLIWGYNNQYPGPTLIVNQGATVTVALTNNLSVATSIVFPGHQVTWTDGDSDGLLTREVDPSGTAVIYSFTATNAGTYMYHSGTRPEVQVEMGLLGAIIVRPSGFDQDTNRSAYGPGTEYEHEYLFLHSEMDPRIHELVESNPGDLDAALAATDYLSDYFPNYWFLNGRVFPDILFPDYIPWLPTQPYGMRPRMHPGEKVLMRFVGGGRDLHPFHPHGSHARVIARDGRLSWSGSGAPRPDISAKEFTIQVVPGETVDAIFEWTGKKVGFDIYGPVVDNTVCTDDDNDGFDDSDPTLLCHDGTCTDDLNNETGAAGADGFDDATYEWCADHAKTFPLTDDGALPVFLPEAQDLTFGGFWSGSPFLGSEEALPPGEGGLNPFSAFTFPWHSHAEKELTNYDIFPGGNLTFLFVEPPGVAIP